MIRKILGIVILLLLITTFVYAEEELETATIYYESIHGNGSQLNTMDLDYPILNFRGVTYLPLTWSVNRHLGLTQEWNEELQVLNLAITEGSVPVIRRFEANYYKENSVAVKISEAKLHLNGAEIVFDEYPMIEYNNILYMPLTWSFLTEKLGWNTRWNEIEGLVINIDGTDSPVWDEHRFKAFQSFMQMYNKKLTPNEAARLTRIVMDASDKYGVADTWVMAVFWQESYYDPYCSYGKALGAMQIMESTGKGYGLNRDQLFIPEINIDFGVRYLSGLRSYYDGDLNKGTLAYNQGTLRVNRGTSRSWYIEDIVEKHEVINNYLSNYVVN